MRGICLGVATVESSGGLVWNIGAKVGQRLVALVSTYPLFLFIMLSPPLYILSLLPDCKSSFVLGESEGFGGRGRDGGWEIGTLV